MATAGSCQAPAGTHGGENLAGRTAEGTSTDARRIASPTIDDVARLVGVSRVTASRALFSEKPSVSAARRERMLAAAELGCRTNPLARSLTTETVDLVAVMVNHNHDL